MTKEQSVKVVNLLKEARLASIYGFKTQVHECYMDIADKKLDRWQVRIYPTASCMIGIQTIMDLMQSVDKRVTIMLSTLEGGCMIFV